MSDHTHIYFSGIGGIGMSALAQMLKERGDSVAGSDRAESPVTKMLQTKGISVVIGQKGENVPEDTNLLVYSAALSADHPERVRAREMGVPELSYFEMLGNVSEGRRTIAISGTHGKTTTTGMLTRILIDAGVSPTAVIGSLVTDFGSNYVTGTGDLFVVEACEYQRHFLNLSPEILVITNIELDHTDYFSSLGDVQDAFLSMIKKVPSHGAIIANADDPNVAPLLPRAVARVISYTKEPHYKLTLPGEFNVENAKAAASAAKAVLPNLSQAHIEGPLKSFSGTWRRFEYKGKTAHGALVYDDYAHHPTAIQETLRALKELRDKEQKGKIIVAFHPHLYSRTRDLLDGFSKAFSDADEVLIAPIFAAREADDGTVSSDILADRIQKEGGNARALSFEKIAEVLRRAGKDDIVMTMGAGDIYKIADTLTGK